MERPMISSTGDTISPLISESTPMKVHDPQPTIVLSRAALWKVKQKGLAE